LVLGSAGSTKNAGYLGYKFSAAGSDSNLLTLGHWGNDNLVVLNGAGNCGIGTTSPSQKLDVNGNIYTDEQYLGGFGGMGSGGTLDWNHVTNARSGSGYTLLMGNAANGPGGTAYYHVFNYEYSSNKVGDGNLTQLAFGYNSNHQYQRFRYSGTWSSWGTVL